jgi:hypothetical protein
MKTGKENHTERIRRRSVRYDPNVKHRDLCAIRPTIYAKSLYCVSNGGLLKLKFPVY